MEQQDSEITGGDVEVMEMRKWLVDIRRGANKTQQDVASAVGISQSYYAGIELGIRGKPVTYPVAKKIAAVLGFDCTLFYEEDSEYKALAERLGRKKT